MIHLEKLVSLFALEALHSLHSGVSLFTLKPWTRIHLSESQYQSTGCLPIQPSHPLPLPLAAPLSQSPLLARPYPHLRLPVTALARLSESLQCVMTHRRSRLSESLPSPCSSGGHRGGAGAGEHREPGRPPSSSPPPRSPVSTGVCLKHQSHPPLFTASLCRHVSSCRARAVRSAARRACRTTAGGGRKRLAALQWLSGTQLRRG